MLKLDPRTNKFTHLISVSLANTPTVWLDRPTWPHLPIPVALAFVGLGTRQDAYEHGPLGVRNDVEGLFAAELTAHPWPSILSPSCASCAVCCTARCAACSTEPGRPADSQHIVAFALRLVLRLRDTSCASVSERPHQRQSLPLCPRRSGRSRAGPQLHVQVRHPRADVDAAAAAVASGLRSSDRVVLGVRSAARLTLASY
jgi:hypothetical protein